jgi:hypothetical protein
MLAGPADAHQNLFMLQHLDENAAWIRAIIENNALGRVDQATQCVRRCPPCNDPVQHT